jgi:hypothetical protein
MGESSLVEAETERPSACTASSNVGTGGHVGSVDSEGRWATLFGDADGCSICGEEKSSSSRASSGEVSLSTDSVEASAFDVVVESALGSDGANAGVEDEEDAGAPVFFARFFSFARLFWNQTYTTSTVRQQFKHMHVSPRDPRINGVRDNSPGHPVVSFPAHRPAFF